MHKCRALGKVLDALKVSVCDDFHYKNIKMCISFNGIQFILNNHTKSTVNSTKIHSSPCYVLEEYLNTFACTKSDKNSSSREESGEITDACSAGPGSGGRGLPMSFTCRPGRRPRSRGRAAPSRRPSGHPTCSASSAPGPGIHLTARGDGPRVKMKTSTGEIYPRLWQACPLGWSQRHTARRVLPSVGTCTETQPAGVHRYSWALPVHRASRGRWGSHWKHRTADVCSSTASRLIFCVSHTQTTLAMLSTVRR